MARRRHNFAPREGLVQAAVLEHWLTFGVPGSLVAAIPNAFAHGQAGLTPGLADLMVIAPQLGSVTGFIELKRDLKSPVSDAQREFGELCGQRGIPYVVAVGRDEPIRVLEAWGAVRRAAA
jgi:hypothetical protein